MAPFRFDKLTVKAQEAVQAAQALADREGHQQLEPEHLLLALVEQEDGVVGALLAKLGARPEAIRRDVQAEIRRLPKVSGTSGQYMGPRLKAVFDAAWEEMERLKDDYCSTEHLLVAIAQDSEGAAGRILRQAGVTKDALYRALVDVRGSQRVTDQNPEAKYQALERYSRDLTELARKGKLDPGDRPGRRGPPGRPGALAADEEQPRPDRRAGRRQDRHRRGAGPADRRRGRPRGPEGQAPRRARPGRPHRRDQVPRRVRGPPEGRAPRDHRGRRRDHLLHRRAPHAGRRRRRRGRDGRLEHAEAGPRARGAPVHRRDHARRVPEARREGRGASSGGSSPSSSRSPPSRTPSRSSAGSRTSTRSTTRSGSRTRRWWRRPSSPTGTSPTGSCPTRPSTSSTRRPRGSGSRSTPCRPSSTRSSAASCSSRSSACRSPRRPTSPRGSASSGWTASSPTSRSARRAFKARWQAREGRHRAHREDHGGDRRGADGDGRRRAARRPQPGGRAPVRHPPPAPAAARGGERAPRRAARATGGSSRRRSTRRTWPRSWPSGPASR